MDIEKRNPIPYIIEIGLIGDIQILFELVYLLNRQPFTTTVIFSFYFNQVQTF